MGSFHDTAVRTVDSVPPSNVSTLLDVKAALETAGIEFIGTPDDSPGIRLRSLDEYQVQEHI